MSKNEGKKSKYKSKKAMHDGITFDSKAEAEYYVYLKNLWTTGKIRRFKLQPVYKLQDSFKTQDGELIRAITYKADFEVFHNNGDITVVDVKGMPTEVAKLKRKLFIKIYSPLYHLEWVAKSLKYGEAGWIDYFELQKIRKNNRKN